MLLQTGIKFRRLNAAYMQKLLNLFLKVDERPEYAICGVGTRVDQDDLDLGIIDDKSSRRKDLNIAIGRLNSEMIRWAIPLHLHLSQYVGEPGFTASIEEYNELLEREIHDFIIISEMLGAKLILGSSNLFKRFENEVTSRYYYRKNKNNIFHEGYLRGILGEVRSLLLQQSREDVICPKEDGMLMVRGILYSKKTMVSIKSANNYEILDELKVKDAINHIIYNDLEEALMFLETFRFLYQLLIIQDEEIMLRTNEGCGNLAIVAEYMGYGGVGCVNAYERLMTHYFEYVYLIKERTEQIFDSVTKHLQSISAFSQLAHGVAASTATIDKTHHATVEFANLTHFFRGTKFWDDVMNTLEEDNSKYLKDIISDLSSLPQKEKTEVIQRYINICHYSFYALISFIMVITKHNNDLPDKGLVNKLNDSLFNAISGSPDEVRRLAKVFSHYPQLLSDYLSSLDDVKQKKFLQLLKIDIWEEETNRFKEKLERLADLHCCTSQYFKRFFHKAIKKYPEYILYLDETSTLRHIAEGVLGEVERHTDLKKKKELLGDYYNIEFLRTGLELLRGAPIELVNVEYTDFSDTYIRMLFDVCKMEIDEEWAKRIATHDLLALFVTGGHGRGQAFDDDYDIIVIINSDDDELLRYSSKIMSRMNAEIIKCGILPHYRFSEYSGNYVNTMSEIASILTDNNECAFIDKAQILGSRRVVGSTIFDEMFDIKIIEPFIFKKKTSFIKDMMSEMNNRHQQESDHRFLDNNIKECLGGLRDIEMFFLILKAHFSLREPISNDLVLKLCEKDKARSANYQQLKQVFDNLKHLRDVYRLTVTADDTLDPEFLDTPCKVLGFSNKSCECAIDDLLKTFTSWTKTSNKIIENNISKIIP